MSENKHQDFTGAVLELNNLCNDFSEKLGKYVEKYNHPGFKSIIFKSPRKPFPKYRLFRGYFGVDSEGILTTPNCKYCIKLPKRFSFRLQAFLNEHVCYAGEIGTKLLFRPDY
jgi:hypothetical protein